VSSLDDLPPPIPRQVDVPPAMPMDGRSVEDILAELADATAERGVLAKTNADWRSWQMPQQSVVSWQKPMQKSGKRRLPQQQQLAKLPFPAAW